MKTKITLGVLACFAFWAFYNPAKNDTLQTKNLDGPWKLTSIYLYENNQLSDSIVSNQEYKQIKIYSNGKVMWTRYVPKDSDEWFGYGTYEVKDGKLIETLEYGSAAMMRVLDTTTVFTFKLELGENNFSQISVDANGNYTQAENYVRIQ